MMVVIHKNALYIYIISKYMKKMTYKLEVLKFLLKSTFLQLKIQISSLPTTNFNLII